MIFLYIIVVAGILACSASQLWLKHAATTRASSLLASMLRWQIILPYTVFVVSLVINITALSYGLALKQLPILEALGYVFVPTLACIFLHEKIDYIDLIAIAFIIAGVIVFHL